MASILLWIAQQSKQICCLLPNCFPLCVWGFHSTKAKDFKKNDRKTANAISAGRFHCRNDLIIYGSVERRKMKSKASTTLAVILILKSTTSRLFRKIYREIESLRSRERIHLILFLKSTTKSMIKSPHREEFTLTSIVALFVALGVLNEKLRNHGREKKRILHKTGSIMSDVKVEVKNDLNSCNVAWLT